MHLLDAAFWAMLWRYKDKPDHIFILGIYTLVRKKMDYWGLNKYVLSLINT